MCCIQGRVLFGVRILIKEIRYYIIICVLSLLNYSRVLATEIGKLKIRQEQAELRELQFDSEDETGIVTDL